MSVAGRRRSLRDLVNVGLGAVGVVLVLCVVLGAVSLSTLTSARSELVDEIDPASVDSARLAALAIDQQNRARAYVLIRDPELAQSALTLRRQAVDELADLRQLLEGRPELSALLDRVQASLELWQREHADPLLASVELGEQVTQEQLRASAAAFADIRRHLGELDDELEVTRVAARSEVQQAAAQLTATLIGIAALLVVVIAVVWLGLRRAVLAPLSRTVEDAQLIAGGDLEHEPRQSGLAELAEVSDALDQVRSELVSQLRAVEAREADLERSNTELEQFAYVASHDLQEPLRKVASFCQMLERRYKGQLDERADTYIHYAVDGATRMQELINDLLAFSRVGRTTEHLEAVELEDVVDVAVRNLSSAIEDSAATIERSPMPEVIGDRSLLVALFQNLISNAIKFRSEDRPQVRVDCTPRGEFYEFTVSDNGIGIPEEYRDRIFVIFQRLHGRSDYEGTGIGLSLVRKIVEFHGGTISIDADDPDAPGTTFRFTLPRVPEHAAVPSELPDLENAT